MAAVFGGRHRKRSSKEKVYDGLVEAVALTILDNSDEVPDLETARQRARERIAESGEHWQSRSRSRDIQPKPQPQPQPHRAPRAWVAEPALT